eukprot:gene1604-biopygen23710
MSRTVVGWQGGGFFLSDNASAVFSGDVELQGNRALKGGGMFVQFSAHVSSSSAETFDHIAFRSQSQWCSSFTPQDQDARLGAHNITHRNRAALVGDDLFIDGCCRGHAGWIRGDDYKCRPCGAGRLERPAYPTAGTPEACDKCDQGLQCRQCTPENIADAEEDGGCIRGAGVGVEPGWWRPEGSVSDLPPTRCVTSNCIGWNASRGGNASLCADGSHGILCGECDFGWILLGADCKSCSGADSPAEFVPGLVGLTVLTLAVTALVVKMSMPESVKGKFIVVSLVKILLLFKQVLSQLPARQRSKGGENDIDWGALAPLISFATRVSLPTPHILRCAIPHGFTLADWVFVYTLLPVGLLAWAVAIACIMHHHQSGPVKVSAKVKVDEVETFGVTLDTAASNVLRVKQVDVCAETTADAAPPPRPPTTARSRHSCSGSASSSSARSRNSAATGSCEWSSPQRDRCAARSRRSSSMLRDHRRLHPRGGGGGANVSVAAPIGAAAAGNHAPAGGGSGGGGSGVTAAAAATAEAAVASLRGLGGWDPILSSAAGAGRVVCAKCVRGSPGTGCVTLPPRALVRGHLCR